MDKYYRLHAGYRGQTNDSEKYGYSEDIYTDVERAYGEAVQLYRSINDKYKMDEAFRYDEYSKYEDEEDKESPESEDDLFVNICLCDKDGNVTEIIKTVDNEYMLQKIREDGLKTYIATYHPIVNGFEKEYKTKVEDIDKAAAEAAVRNAYINQMKNVRALMERYHVVSLVGSLDDVIKNIEYAKENMVIKIEEDNEA